MTWQNAAWKAGTGVAVACAILITATNAAAYYAKYHPRPSRPWRIVLDWPRYAGAGTRLGAPKARVAILEFADYQCPACKRLAPLLEELVSRYPNDIEVVVRHFPIEGPMSDLAARTAICAGQQHVFPALNARLFAVPVLTRSTIAYAAASVGLTDSVTLARCVKDPATERALAADVAAGNELKIFATPTMLINGEQYMGVPHGLEGIVQRQLEKTRAQ